MINYPSFYDLADRIQDKRQMNLLMQHQHYFFEINPYKVQKLLAKIAKNIYSQILNKYEVTKEFKIMENYWQENQRRLFIWYIIIFLKLEKIDPSQYKQIDWESLTKIFFNKKPQFLQFQFSNLIKIKGKISWNDQQDEILLKAIEKEKQGKWNQVSKRIFYQSDRKIFKSPKHCRERWFNHLDKTKNKGAWTLKQDVLIFKFIIQNGKRWAIIVKSLENSRTEHMIKNRYNSLIAKFKKHKKKREQQVAKIAFRQLEIKLKTFKKQHKLKQIQNNLDSIQNIKKQSNNQLQNSEIKKIYNKFEEKQQQNSIGKLMQAKIESTDIKYFAQIDMLPQFQIRNKQKIQCLNNNTHQINPINDYANLNYYGTVFYYENTSINLFNGFWNTPYLPMYQGSLFF